MGIFIRLLSDVMCSTLTCHISFITVCYFMLKVMLLVVMLVLVPV